MPLLAITLFYCTQLNLLQAVIMKTTTLSPQGYQVRETPQLIQGGAVTRVKPSAWVKVRHITAFTLAKDILRK